MKEDVAVILGPCSSSMKIPSVIHKRQFIIEYSIYMLHSQLTGSQSHSPFVPHQYAGNIDDIFQPIIRTDYAKRRRFQNLMTVIRKFDCSQRTSGYLNKVYATIYKVHNRVRDGDGECLPFSQFCAEHTENIVKEANKRGKTDYNDIVELINHARADLSKLQLCNEGNQENKIPPEVWIQDMRNNLRVLRDPHFMEKPTDMDPRQFEMEAGIYELCVQVKKITENFQPGKYVGDVIHHFSGLTKVENRRVVAILCLLQENDSFDECFEEFLYMMLESFHKKDVLLDQGDGKCFPPHHFIRNHVKRMKGFDDESEIEDNEIADDIQEAMEMISKLKLCRKSGLSPLHDIPVLRAAHFKEEPPKILKHHFEIQEGINLLYQQLGYQRSTPLQLEEYFKDGQYTPNLLNIFHPPFENRVNKLRFEKLSDLLLREEMQSRIRLYMVYITEEIHKSGDLVQNKNGVCVRFEEISQVYVEKIVKKSTGSLNLARSDKHYSSVFKKILSDDAIALDIERAETELSKLTPCPCAKEAKKTKKHRGEPQESTVRLNQPLTGTQIRAKFAVPNADSNPGRTPPRQLPQHTSTFFDRF